jgi:hypothetical protein
MNTGFDLPAVLTLMVASFVLGLVLIVSHDARTEPLPVICESGAFAHVAQPNPADPYLREQATCNIGGANGRAVQVLVID